MARPILVRVFGEQEAERLRSLAEAAKEVFLDWLDSGKLRGGGRR